jgi:hypothetical protein
LHLLSFSAAARMCLMASAAAPRRTAHMYWETSSTSRRK